MGVAKFPPFFTIGTATIAQSGDIGAVHGGAPTLECRKITVFRTLVLVRPMELWPGQNPSDFIDCGMSLAKGLTSSA
jgi:hypothetical protein